MNYSTPCLLEVLKAVKVQYPHCAAQIESTFLRYLLSLLGYTTAGRRITKLEKENIYQFLATHLLPLLSLIEWKGLIDEALTRSGLEKSQQRFPRFYLNKIVDCIEKKRWTRSDESLIPTTSEIVKRRNVTPVVDKSALNQSKQKKVRPPKISLSHNPLDYLEIHKPLFSDKTDAEVLSIIKNELSRIQKELDSCSYYFAHKDKEPLAKRTLELWLKHIRPLIGWNFFKAQDLRKVGLSKIIPVVKRDIYAHEYENTLDYFKEKESIEIKLKDAAKYTVDFIQSFFNEYGKNQSKKTKIIYIENLIRTAKFLYKDITDGAYYDKYQDIPVILRLRILLNNLNSGPKKIKNLLLTWDEILLIRKELKKEVDNIFNYHKDSKGNIKKTERAISSIAKNLRQFLAFCFLTVMPPIRARTISELEFQRTLKHGLFDNSGFIPKEKLSDPSTARYYYHFCEGDYKTWKIYGDFLAPIANEDFGDGTCFYDYLDKYIYGGYRDTLLSHQQNHQLIFVKILDSKNGLAGDPLSKDDFGAIIRNITEKYAKIKVGPHAFRAIYRTHLVNSGASSEVLAAAAYAMHHSTKVAQDSYTVQTRYEKLRPILDLIRQNEKK